MQWEGRAGGGGPRGGAKGAVGAVALALAAAAQAAPGLTLAWAGAGARPALPSPVPELLPPDQSPLLPPAPYAALPMAWTRALRLLPEQPLAASRIYAPRPRVAFPGTAFAAPRDCSVDPFAGAAPDDLQTQLAAPPCGRDRLRLGVDGSRVALPQAQQPQLLAPLQVPTTLQAAPVKLEVDQLQTQQWSALHLPLTTSVRLGWQGSRDARLGEVQSEQRALLATGSLIRLGPDAALDLRIGRQRQGPLSGPGSAELATRTSVTGLWRPAGRHMVYLQRAEERVQELASVAHEAGMRLVLQPGRVWLDLGARRSAQGQPLEPRVALSMQGFLR